MPMIMVHADDHGRGRQIHPEEKEEKEVVGKIDIEKEVYVKSGMAALARWSGVR